jgi:hypothetical protein
MLIGGYDIPSPLLPLLAAVPPALAPTNTERVEEIRFVPLDRGANIRSRYEAVAAG